MKPEVTFTYKNYRGEISVRLVRPIMVAFGATGFHPEPQWLLHGWDLNKDAERTFAMKDICDWEPAPEAPGHTDLMVTPESIDSWLEKNPLPSGDTRPDSTCYLNRTSVRSILIGAATDTNAALMEHLLKKVDALPIATGTTPAVSDAEHGGR